MTDLAPPIAIASRPTAQRASPLSASLAFGWRAFLKIKHVPEQLGDVVGIPIIFTLMFTYLFGGALAGSTGAYLSYLLPGTLVMSVVLVTIYSGVTLRADISTGASDRFRALPIWRPAPIIGAMIGDVARYLIAATLVIALGLLLGYRPAGGAAGLAAAVGLVLIFASALSWIFTTLGLVLRTSAAVMNTGMLVLFPLTFASNVFVKPHTMPQWLQRVVTINPLSHLVTATRELAAGTATTSHILWVLAASGVLVAVFGPLTMRLYNR
ncbi:MAG TPA: ABC transporter permease [Solirubrobacteraceae bacterium]|nr:ABC transporter permease [Solirubrobacteraceae bacterium]